MNDVIFQLHSWPRAIIHVDCDAFFTSCEEAIHPQLRGKPLIAGGERGIVACASYAAKARGIKRGVSLREAKRICPELIVLPSDYETYSLFSRRLFNLMRRVTPQVEEYSIDEAFADITGLRRKYHTSYERIARNIKRNIWQELGISITLGLSITKVLAKVASKYAKPDGFTVISGRTIPLFLRELPVEKVWGIGQATTNHLWKLGVTTALDLARLPERRIAREFTKPGREIWHELRGDSVWPVVSEEKSTYASISKTKTFAPPTCNREYLFAQLLRNVESACIKARRYFLTPRRLAIFLKTNSFAIAGCEAKLLRPSAYPLELMGLLKQLFDSAYQDHVSYRATGVVLLDLLEDRYVQYSLFEDPVTIDKIEKVYAASDILSRKYGKHTLHLGASHPIDQFGKGRRGTPTVREKTRLFGETKRKHLGLPILHVKV